MTAPRRTFASARDAYLHARAHGPSDDTRAVACGEAEYGYLYARYVDQGPRDDTRAAAFQDPLYAYLYSWDVDGEEPVYLGMAGVWPARIMRSVGVVRIGCQVRTVEDWAANWKQIAKDNGLDVTEEEAEALLTAAPRGMETP